MIKRQIFQPNRPRAILIFMNGVILTLFFSHPKDFTPVCATEISALSASEGEFKKRNCKLIGLSVDSLESHFDWLSEMEETYGSSIEFPIIADKNHSFQNCTICYQLTQLLKDLGPQLLMPPLGRSILSVLT